ncbi:MAG: beta-galactosidase [Terrimicrobiaceae bacterium]
MKFLAILEDPAVTPIPSYTAADVRRAFEKAGLPFVTLDLKALGTLDRHVADVLVLPYLDGDLSGDPLAGIVRFHAAGGGLLFLGDTPHVGRSFPYRNSQAPDLRLTRCRDPLEISGLTPMGEKLLGDLPDLGTMIHKKFTGIRTSAFPPDECHNLLECAAGFKELSPVVFIERRHGMFLGARAAVVGFDGGEPRENLMGVCNLPWTFDPGLLTREWAGADQMVARLAAAVLPPEVALAIDFNPVVAAGSSQEVALVARNISSAPRAIEAVLHAQVATSASPDQPVTATLLAGETRIISTREMVCPLGPVEISATLADQTSVRRTCFAFAERTDSPQLSMGFSVFRAFRTPSVDAAYRDFVHSVGGLGMQYVRMELAWEDLEPEPGHYVWDVPDQLLALAASENLPAFLWVFPTARGSGLSEGGVPAWALREPSIDRDGNPGNFPCIWSPFYRERYFAFLTALASRYADDPRLVRFIFDFGNSDFSYTYHYYGDRGDLFDYSPHEQAAFAGWLESGGFSIRDLERRWGRAFSDYRDVPVPLSEQREAWLLYEEFRVWGVHQGIKEAVGMIRRHAPSKMPPDFPGHGLGSIADIGTYVHHAQASHWNEVAQHDPALTEAHNMGEQWGGEPWQVGARYPDYDDALFQSVRLEADYLTIPGPDLGVWENDIGRVAMIRRTLAGAKRARPRIAIMDRMAWNDFGSLAHVGARLDQPVDIISRTCRYDYACYDLLVLPPDEIISTSRGPASILPLDGEYYSDMLDAVKRGLKVVVFPRTGLGDPLNPMRRTLGLHDVDYGPRVLQAMEYPASWGGGSASGFASIVEGAPGDQVLLRNSEDRPLAVFRPCGLGGFILTGYDSAPDSFDADFRYDRADCLSRHSLARLLLHLDIVPADLRTGQAGCYKECLFSAERDFLLFYSHLAGPLPINVQFGSSRSPRRILELSSGAWHDVSPGSADGWYQFFLTLPPAKGHYFVIE